MARGIRQIAPVLRHRVFLLGLTLGLIAGSALMVHLHAVADSALPAGVFCQGPQTSQSAASPKKVMTIVLENESSATVDDSPDAPFQNGTLNTQCGGFSEPAMHSTTHGSESNYFALVSGLNAAIDSGTDALARFGLSDCPPDATSSTCAYGGGHFDSTVPSLFSQIENTYGTSGWKTYSDDMPQNCVNHDANIYATDSTGKTYAKYVVRHNPAVYFYGTACSTQDVPSGNWQSGQGTLYNDLMNGTLPPYSFVQPNDIENGHDPVSVNGQTIAGGTSQIGNIDNYLSSFLTLVRSSPDYQSGNLVVFVTYDEGAGHGSVAGDGSVGENCADPNISPLATSCQVKTWVVGRYVPNYTYGGYMNQFGLLAATQRLLGLSPLLGHAGDAAVPDIVNGTSSAPDPFNLASSGGSVTVTPPQAPQNVTASAGNTTATVSFSPPSFSGGSPITGYTVTASPGGQTVSGTGSPITVGGLTNGTSYTFTVTATNSAGTGPASAASNSVTPAAATNLLTGGDMESGLSGFSPYSSSSVLSLVTTPVNSGNYALQVTNSTKKTTGFNAPKIPGSLLTAGQSLTGSCWVNAPAANYHALIRLTEGGGYAVLGETKSAALTPGVWTQVSITGTVLRTGDQMVLSAYTNDQVLGATGLTWDDCMVTTPVPPPVLTVPSAPQNVTATAGDTTATVSFSPPSSTGGSSIASYTVVASPGGLSATGTASPITVSGLTDGTTYTFTVTATNSAGAGPASAASNAVTPAVPANVPAAPTNLAVTPGDGQAALSWTAPADTGGADITDYVVQSAPSGSGNWTTFNDGISATPSATITGLQDGSGYDFRVAAVNSAGQGDWSTVATSTLPAVVPGAPTNLLVVPSDGAASVSFSPPASDGGSPITGYTVTASPGGQTASGPSGPITVTGLTDGTSYTFTVTATNAVGTGPASVASSPAVPATVPGAPTGASATDNGDGSATVQFSVPADNGGSPITGYTVTANPGGQTTTGNGSPLIVSGLTFGTSYTFTVTATNAMGTGPASDPSSAITPQQLVTAPSAPQNVTATPGNTTATVSFSAPTGNGGAPITGYTVTASPSGQTASGPSGPITVTGLTNGTSYTFTVTATNSAGTGLASAASNSVTPYLELLSDPGFETSTSGFKAFSTGTLTLVSSPVHGGSSALQVSVPSGVKSGLVGLSNPTIVTNSVAGKSYTFSCYVQPTVANLNVIIRYLEYTQNYSSDIHFTEPLYSKLPVGVWTFASVTVTAVNSGERMIPQIYSGNQASSGTNGNIIYDDCSVSSN